MRAPKLVRSSKIALYVRISPETRDSIEQRAHKERKSFTDLIEEAFGPKDKPEEEPLAELTF
jgi:hypothetical protein